MTGPDAPVGSGDILALLAAASDPGGVVITEEQGELRETPNSVLWEQAGRTGSVMRSRSPDGVAATMLSPTAAALACLVGGWRAGLTMASLPLPPRSARRSGLIRWVTAMCSDVGARLLVVDDAMRARLEGLTGLDVLTFGELERLSAAMGTDDHGGGWFVQYSSGSTGHPKGIVLSLQAIGANALAVQRALGQPSLRLLSWLPLSHDLGLMAALAGWVAMAENRGGPGAEILFAPDRFLLSPGRWVEQLSEHRATVTAAPPTSYHLAARRPPRGRVDLSALKAALVGAEPIRPEVLHSFSNTFAPAGLSPEALCPAYGLAEATVGVSAVRPHERWSAVAVDADDLAVGGWSPTVDGGVRLVSNGRPLDGVAVRVDPGAGTGVGRLQVSGPSLASGCSGQGSIDIADGWLTTSDLGWIDDAGEVFVVGRADDLIILGGRNVHPEQLEASVQREGLARASGCAVVPDVDGYAVVSERPRQPRPPDPSLCRSIRKAVVGEAGIGPRQVVLVPRGWLPRTVTGKIQRRAVAADLARGALPDAFVLRFDGRS